jgi:hypothetical protein
MRFFRLMAITVLLLACVVLGSACAGAKGEEGAQGPKGNTGAAGVGVENIVNNGDGTFTVNLTNGESYTTDDFTGPRGEQGDQGPQGIQGLPGTPGIGVEWVGEWDSSVLYAKYDAVGYQGSSYISKHNDNTNHLPTDTDWWDLWVEKGNTGATGATGADGADGQDGAPGPNMIVAMGLIDANGSVVQGYNVTSVTWDVVNEVYIIELTGIEFQISDFVVLVTPAAYAGIWPTYTIMPEYPGRLVVAMMVSGLVDVSASFSFMVLECP